MGINGGRGIRSSGAVLGGRGISLAGGGGFDPDPASEAIFAQMTANGSTPSEERQVIIDQLVKDLKGLGNTGSSDVWNKLDILQVYAAEDEIQALTEWKQANGTYDASKINSPNFTSNIGYSSSNSTNTIETNWALNSNLGNYTRNDACFGAFGSTAQSVYFFGESTGYLTYIRGSVSATDQSMNNSSFPSGNWGAIGQGHYALNRNNSSNFQMFLNGVQVDSVTKNSAPLSSSVIKGPVINGIGASIGNVFYCGASLTSDEYTQIHNSIDTYLNSI